MALALQSSLKRKTGAWEPYWGINTHHFSSAQQSTSPWRTYLLHKVDCVWLHTILPNAPLIPSVFLQTPFLCFSAVLTSSELPGRADWCSTAEGLNRLRWACYTMPGWWDRIQLQKQSGSKTKTYELSLSLTWCFCFTQKKKVKFKKKFPSSSYQGFSLKIGWNPVEKQRTETKGGKCFFCTI